MLRACGSSAMPGCGMAAAVWLGWAARVVCRRRLTATGHVACLLFQLTDEFLLLQLAEGLGEPDLCPGRVGFCSHSSSPCACSQVDGFRAPSVHLSADAQCGPACHLLSVTDVLFCKQDCRLGSCATADHTASSSQRRAAVDQAAATHNSIGSARATFLRWRCCNRRTRDAYTCALCQPAVGLCRRCFCEAELLDARDQTVARAMGTFRYR